MPCVAATPECLWVSTKAYLKHTMNLYTMCVWANKSINSHAW